MEVNFDKSFEKLRCNLYLPSHVVEELDQYCKKFGTNRSVMTGIILKTYFDQQKMVRLVDIVEGNQISDK